MYVRDGENRAAILLFLVLLRVLPNFRDFLLPVKAKLRSVYRKFLIVYIHITIIRNEKRINFYELKRIISIRISL